MKLIMATMAVIVVSVMGLTGSWITDRAKAARLRHESARGLDAEADAFTGAARRRSVSAEELKNLAVERARAGAKWAGKLTREAKAGGPWSQRPSNKRRKRAFASGVSAGPASGARAAPRPIQAN